MGDFQSASGDFGLGFGHADPTAGGVGATSRAGGSSQPWPLLVLRPSPPGLSSDQARRRWPPAHGLARGANTQLVLSSTGPGESVSGYIANPGSAFDPTEGYPTEIPPPDFSSKDESFAGVIYGTPVGGGAEISLYCIDILTDTYIGNGYALGTWDEANVPNVGYVARILDEYYPNTDKPSTTPDGVDLTTNETAAAVQAAVWFFSDKYVLSTSEAIESTVA